MDDEILTVNNVSLGNVTHLQAVQALKDAGQHVTLVCMSIYLSVCLSVCICMHPYGTYTLPFLNHRRHRSLSGLYEFTINCW